MQTLRTLATYARWANRIVFDLCRDLDPAVLAEPAPGTIGSIQQTLEHLVCTGDDCFQMLEGRAPLQTVDEMLAHVASYRGRDLAWLAEGADLAGAGFERALADADPAFLDGELRPPAMSRRSGMLHALTHSMHHRAQVLSVLGARVVKVPDIDYGFFLFRADQAPSA
jgi:uncharacterized damage-inducible protein DinB